ncbi:MAG: hypothetical protein M3Q93_05645, partial [Gemmatimonadota bacterium]|nr:hypothetical protein [Gemmatimonadota bacterium]
MLPYRPALLVGLTLLLSPVSGAAQAVGAMSLDTAALERLLRAEDARGTAADGLGPLLAALTRPDTMLRRVAVRGLGRLQRPEFGRRLLQHLGDPLPQMRGEAANAVAQSLSRV